MGLCYSKQKQWAFAHSVGVQWTIPVQTADLCLKIQIASPTSVLQWHIFVGNGLATHGINQRCTPAHSTGTLWSANFRSEYRNDTQVGKFNIRLFCRKIKDSIESLKKNIVFWKKTLFISLGGSKWQLCISRNYRRVNKRQNSVISDNCQTDV